MKILRPLTLLTLALFATFVLVAQEVVVIGGIKYTIHDVAKGETLYSLARHYGVTVDEIKGANATLSEGLKSGTRIKIPIKQSVTATPTAQHHKVTRGETLYSLSKRYGVTIETLLEANPDVRGGLKVGQILTLTTTQKSEKAIEKVAEKPSKQPTKPEKTVTAPEPKVAPVATPTSTPTPTPTEVEQPTSTEDEATEQPSFRSLREDEKADVALLLPLGSEERPSQNYLDFYRGFLIGLDSVRMSGRSINLNLYNTAHDHNRISDIIASGELEKADLVVGPVYEDELIPVAAALQGKGVPVVSPLANLTQTASRTVFQMSPSPTSKLEKVRSMFDGSKRVVIISTDNIDKEFDAEIRSMLKDTSYVVEHKYIYEHPSVIEKREKEREKLREKMLVEGLENVVIDETPSPSDMSPLLRGEEESVIVITANNEVDVDRILAAIASANIALTARSQRVVPFVIFGNNRWNRYRNIDRAILFANNVTMLSTYHAHRSEPKIRNFDRRFVQEYGSLPSLYAYRGYDAAVVFVKALYGTIESNLEGAHFLPLLSPYTFERDNESGVLINSSWVKVNYNSNYTITIE